MARTPVKKAWTVALSPASLASNADVTFRLIIVSETKSVTPVKSTVAPRASLALGAMGAAEDTIAKRASAEARIVEESIILRGY
jgi:hypothetical protein